MLSNSSIVIMKVFMNSRIIQAVLVDLFLLTWTNGNLQAQTFTGEGHWEKPDLWDTGVLPGYDSTGINNRCNQLNTISTIEPDGILSFVIDGDQVGSMERANRQAQPILSSKAMSPDSGLS
ncbi:MAG TPA: hypothetical protein DCR61_10260 [Verrucomicrobiales bacterium]|nr:hypothetical protein [Verrucomicrobiales bacterium]HAW01622.1 hypothetical protein [Verrucomicrobiales bacterium]HCZ05143.1 hypothetical protein [Verrucomicrobiales bacterium]|tara:strand:+ start:4401 stop:4763 length:363 start_codon:yes stop_codon:yes gene_type:complete